MISQSSNIDPQIFGRIAPLAEAPQTKVLLSTYLSCTPTPSTLEGRGDLRRHMHCFCVRIRSLGL